MTYSYEEYFASNQQETENPFLTERGRKWGKELPLRTSLLSLFFLIIAYIFDSSLPSLSKTALGFVYFLSGTPALIQTIEEIGQKIINIDVLMTLAALLSVLIGAELEGGLLLVLFALSEGMEEVVTNKTKSALTSLHNLIPSLATIVDATGTKIQRSVKEIAVGEHLFVQAGEVVPLDAKIIEGSSFCNISHLTGESLPISKKVGDSVAAGTLLIDSSLLLEVTERIQNSTLAKIINLITEAQQARPRLQKMLDQFSGIYAKTIILLACLFALILPFFGVPFQGFEGSIYRALAFLIAASPCALIIATPTAYLSSISAAAKRGILLKGGISLDACAKCTKFAFDKTGTLTTGELEVASVDQEGPFPLDTALRIAASLENHSTHPIAKAIIKYVEQKKLASVISKEIQVIAGDGVKGTILIDDREIEAFIGKSNHSLSSKAVVTQLLVEGSTFTFHLTDHIREEAKTTIEQLSSFGTILMLTGDRKESAEPVAEFLGIKEVFSELTPQEKLQKIEELSAHHFLAMTGDGINDGPALARSTCGISIGTGLSSQTAIEASDIVIMKNDLTLIPQIVRQSKRTMKIVKQNLTIALSIILFITTPSLLGYIPLWLAVVLHEGGTVIVGLNSLRLLKWKEKS